MFHTIIAIIDVLLVVLPSLLSVAFVTVAERKTMASMQRRLGPNLVGHYGLLQAFADALKLLLKEYVGPTQSNFILFVLGPLITLNFSLLGYGVVAYGAGMAISDLDLGILYMLAVSSLSTYGILLAGWSANSKYAFLGSLRSTAQLISYELILSSIILLVVLLSGTLNITLNIEAQKMIYFLFPLFPLFIIFFIGCIAETNRAPFDLAEAESELVSGFMTEHSAVIFVFFFLAEYASIILICIFSSILFIGGYLVYYTSDELINMFFFLTKATSFILNSSITIFTIIYQGIISSITLGYKTCILIFIFILARASFPRVRYDQLMSYCWTILLPLIIGFILFIPCLVFSLSLIPVNTSLDDIECWMSFSQEDASELPYIDNLGYISSTFYLNIPLLIIFIIVLFFYNFRELSITTQANYNLQANSSVTSLIILLTIGSNGNMSIDIPELLIKEASLVFNDFLKCIIMVEIAQIFSDYMLYSPDITNEGDIQMAEEEGIELKDLLIQEGNGEMPDIKDDTGIHLVNNNPLEQKDLELIKTLGITAGATLDSTYIVYMTDYVPRAPSPASPDNAEDYPTNFTSESFNTLLNDIVRINRIVHPLLRTAIRMMAIRLREHPGEMTDISQALVDQVEHLLEQAFQRDRWINADNFDLAGMTYPLVQIVWEDWFIVNEETDLFDEHSLDFEGMFQVIDDNDMPEDYFRYPESQLIGDNMDIQLIDFATLISEGISESDLLSLLHLPAGTNLNGFVGISFDDLMSIHTNMQSGVDQAGADPEDTHESTP